jgi:hypothetical protein
VLTNIASAHTFFPPICTPPDKGLAPAQGWASTSGPVPCPEPPAV